MTRKRDLYSSIVYARKWAVLGQLAYYLLKILGIEIPQAVEIGKDFELAHGGFGVVIHPKSMIGERVKMYPGVTLGRSDIHLPFDQSQFEGITIEDDVILASGSKVLCNDGILTVKRGTVVGANAVLLNSTSEDEIWVGIPAKCIGKRDYTEKIRDPGES